MSASGTVQLKTWEAGEGEVTVIFLHGFPLDHTIWEPVLPFLRQGKARLILPDLRGHGASPVPPGAYTMHDMAGDIAALMDDRGIDRAILAGHSMGGYISFAFARAFPQRLQGLALVATHPLGDDEARREGRLRMAASLEQHGIEGIAASMLDNLTCDAGLRMCLQNLIRTISASGAANALRGMAVREEAVALLGSIQVPSVVIAGEMDQIVPLAVAEDMAARLPSSRLVVIPNAGHMPMMENPKLTAGALADLISLVKALETR